ncbi:uncharacterized protein LOC143203510 [Rhynchophorus ferrugineus]|uniref:uncharacterized protein LOC143203510 n=1 Tax=Rhynchophorus ferrugineus TaxID=354439 RepID=UPI003FCC94C8
MSPNKNDYVIQSEVLKAQGALEKKTRTEWDKKWGFYLNFNKICLEEAERQGVSEGEWRRRLMKQKKQAPTEDDIWQINPADFVPGTTYGHVGWRAYQKHSLEKFGPLYVSPKLTLPQEQSYSNIMLG